ncbi:MAG: transporter substrate-binding domain-containing protein [Pseudomonadota bacterium]
MAALFQPTAKTMMGRTLFMAVLMASALVVLTYGYSANAQSLQESTEAQAGASAAFPDFLGPRTDVALPDIRGVTRFRFLTTTDFPPFNFVDGAGRLTGFHVDLARSICDVVQLGARCQIEAMPFDELTDVLQAGNGEAVLAGQSIEGFAGIGAVASPVFLRFAGRFLARKDARAVSADPLDLPEGTRVAVVEASAHEAYLRAFFPKLTPVAVTDRTTLQLALTSAIVDHAFDDAPLSVAWLAGSASSQCCSFASGPYFSDRYFGDGLTIATRKGDAISADIVEYALYEMRRQNRFQELYLRHFPVAPY